MRLSTLLCLVMLVVTLALFSRTAGFDFINFDDPGYVTANSVVKGGLHGGSVAWALQSSEMSNWHPLTWLSHMTDVQLFGLKPAGHHLTSVVLHTVSAFLLFLLLVRLTAMPWRSLVVAGLFALHPMHVESVAWVAERKDVLSGLFWHLTLLMYVAYVHKPKPWRYLATMGCFVLGLMAKPMLVTLPVVLLLLDWWPLNRFRRDQAETAPAPRTARHLFLEKVPFFLISLLSSAATIFVQQHGGAVQSLEKVQFGLRLANVFIAYVRYLIGMFWPHDMAILYPFPTEIILWQLAGSILVLIAISAAVFFFRRRFPYLATGWLWFVVTLLPVIGLIQVGGQSHADRYTYLPYTGLSIIAVWGVSELCSSLSFKEKALAALSVLTLAVCAVMTWQQLGFWRNNITLYRHTLAVTSNNYLILNNYGIALNQEYGDADGALAAYQEALRIWPNSALTRNNLGTMYLAKGRYAEALEQFREASRLDPGEPMVMVNAGRALAKAGRLNEAAEQFAAALRQDPAAADAHLQLAILLIKSGRSSEARPHYEAVQKLEPSSARGPLTIAVELAAAGMVGEADGYFRQAMTIEPNSLDVNFNLGVFLAKQNRLDEAAHCFYRVLQQKPDSDLAKNWLKRIGR
ncbi:O-GlcNAc transferase [Geomonas silvestris]|uniref:O-GlcNAc transferase n=1 Tax=Geomonas silvestris TaxID=2740184 RepID=A0A6V8MKV8_9BACT|nr:tetratricopeptide repeat protein [Geomonas silvestris]GFO60675.1 O-GlcNAc transferase [Geomonas silvestris]